MKYTNNLGLPEPIVNAVTRDPYTKGDAQISITGLLSPPRIRVLKKKHEAELTEDVSERIFSLLGQIVHGILERANVNALSEQRFYLEIEGITISGQLDAYYESGLIQDYKLVSLYSVKDGVKPEYIEQLNCYAYLVKHGYYIKKTVVGGAVTGSGAVENVYHQEKIYPNCLVNKLEDVFILRDWSKGKARLDPTIPQQQIIKLDVSLWSDEETLAFITKRIQLHKAANKKLPECTTEERWAVPDKYAVMAKKGAARSLKNHESLEMAELHAAQVKGAFVEVRLGKNTRCDDYCQAAPFCTQYKKLKGETE